MREIKFRAWSKTDKLMAMDIQNEYDTIAGVRYWKNGDKTDIEPGESSFCGYLDNDRYYVMQYTGLKDKNEKEIYEGDVLLYKEYHNGTYPDKYKKKSVEWGETGDSDGYSHNRHLEWVVDQDSLADVVDGDCEIIGNIYENPELLK